MASFWEKLREQEVVDFRLLIALPVVLVVGVVVWVVFGMGGSGTGDRSAPGLDEQVYVCHFDQTERNVSGEALWELEADGDALINRGGTIPTRVRCTKCNRMSCFTNDVRTGEPVAVDESWDLSENAQAEAGGRGGRGGGRGARGR